MSMLETLVIAGASHAGLQLAASARELGFDGRIVMIGDEAHLPYQRPPLSKGLLIGGTDPGGIALKSQSFFDDSRIELISGRRVAQLDAAARLATLDDGRKLHGDWFALCTGARARRPVLPGADLQGVLTLRSLDDAMRLDAMARGAVRACVIGGGFIGLEVAAALVSRGLEVTLVESCMRPLERAMTPEVADSVVAAHRARGVRLLLQRKVKALHGRSGALDSVGMVEIEGGERIECDLVVVGIGAIPNAELAVAAGLRTERGVITDRLGRTSAPHVLAAGDCAAFPNPFAPDPTAPVLLESIQIANDMARAAATNLVGRPVPYGAVPWFWSDQHDLKLQMAGLMAPSDARAIRGDPSSGRFSVFGLRQGRIAWVHSVNRPADHVIGRRLIAAGVEAAADALASMDLDLKTLLATAPATTTT